MALMMQGGSWVGDGHHGRESCTVINQHVKNTSSVVEIVMIRSKYPHEMTHDTPSGLSLVIVL